MGTRQAIERIKRLLPTGRTLPYEAWRRRHHAMVGILLAEAVGLFIFSLAQGNGLLHSTADAAPIVPIALLGLKLEHRRRAASVLVSLGLITACAVLVHLWHGAIEAHFLFFITIMLLALYEDWVAFGIAFGYVVLHHGLMGALDPSGVYNHQNAVDHPWKWALIHGGFVLAAGAVAVTAWRLNEVVRAAAVESEQRFRGAFEGAPIGMVLFRLGEEGGVTQVNQAMCDISGRSAEQLEAADMRSMVHPEDARILRDAFRQLSSGDEPHPQCELRYIHADGHTV